MHGNSFGHKEPTLRTSQEVSSVPLSLSPDPSPSQVSWPKEERGTEFTWSIETPGDSEFCVLPPHPHTERFANHTFCPFMFCLFVYLFLSPGMALSFLHAFSKGDEPFRQILVVRNKDKPMQWWSWWIKRMNGCCYLEQLIHKLQNQTKQGLLLIFLVLALILSGVRENLSNNAQT